MSWWEGKRVLITGGAGFIGSNLAARLVELGARVRVVDNLTRGRLENLEGCLQSLEFLPRDLAERESCLEACQGMEVVIHLAAKVGGIGYYLQQPAQVMIQNTLMDTLVLQAAQTCGASRYIYASSAHVYPLELQQRPDAPLLREEDAIPAHPHLSYGWAKLLGEKQVEYSIAQSDGLKAGILRLIGVYGPNQDIDLATGSAIPVFIRRAIEYPQRKPFLILGSGQETRSYCYVGDVVEAIVLTLEELEEQQLIGPLNVGGEERIRIQDLAKEIIAISGKDIAIVNDPSYQTTIWGQALDCSKARQLLDGWQPRRSLREGLERTYAYIEARLGNEGPERGAA